MLDPRICRLFRGKRTRWLLGHKIWWQIEDEKTREILYTLIKGSGAFGRFKNAIHIYEIAEDWYKFRNDAFKEIAIEWCRENNIEYDD